MRGSGLVLPFTKAEGVPACHIMPILLPEANAPHAALIDRNSDSVEIVRELIRRYRSQLELAQAYDHLGMGLAAWNSRFLPNGPEARYAEIFTTLPATEFVRLAARTYGGDLRDVYGTEPGLAAVMGKLDRETA